MITGNLEYIMCSLPNLTFKDTAEERSKVFSILIKYAGPSESEKDLVALLNEEAGKFLGPKAYRIFQQIDLATIHTEAFQKNKYKVLAVYSSYLHALKKDLQQLRISRKNGLESGVEKSSLPLVPGTPLDEEIQLLKWQWDKLEELSIGHYTDFEALSLYKLKLLLLLRWWAFDREQGFAIFLNSTNKIKDGR